MLVARHAQDPTRSASPRLRPETLGMSTRALREARRPSTRLTMSRAEVKTTKKVPGMTFARASKTLRCAKPSNESKPPGLKTPQSTWRRVAHTRKAAWACSQCLALVYSLPHSFPKHVMCHVFRTRTSLAICGHFPWALRIASAYSLREHSD